MKNPIPALQLVNRPIAELEAMLIADAGACLVRGAELNSDMRLLDLMAHIQVQFELLSRDTTSCRSETAAFLLGLYRGAEKRLEIMVPPAGMLANTYCHSRYPRTYLKACSRNGIDPKTAEKRPT